MTFAFEAHFGRVAFEQIGGNMAYNGVGMAAYKQTAFDFYYRAAELGSREARQILDGLSEEAGQYVRK